MTKIVLIIGNPNRFLLSFVRDTLVPYGLTKRSCYVIAACSEKELPDNFTHSKKGSPQPLTNLTAQRSIQRPNGRSPTAPNEPQRPANLRATHSRGGRVDANASRALATRSGGGRNAPRFPRDDTTPQLPNNGSRLQFASARGNSRVTKR